MDSGNIVALESHRKKRDYRMNKKKQPARVIAVSSGKGGVGKTNTTVNVGLALSKLGKRVLLLDADLGLANINILLGFEPKATLQQVVEGKAKLEDIIVDYDYNFDIIPASSGIQNMTDLSEESRLALLNAVDQLATDYDYVFVDTAAGIGDNVIYFNVAAEDHLIVVDKEPTSITDAYALIKILSTENNIKEFFVVANRTPVGTDGRATYAKLAGATDRFLSVSLKFLGAISDDPMISQAVVQQKACISLYPGTKASLDYTKLAQRIIETEGARKPRGGLQFFFKEIIESAG